MGGPYLIMTLYDRIGFSWEKNSDIVIPSEKEPLSTLIFKLKKRFPEFVWDASQLENNPITFPEIKTLLDGITIGGHKLSDVEQVTNLADSLEYLIKTLKNDSFKLDRDTFCKFNSIISRNESLEWGVFRGEGSEINYTPNVALGERGVYKPLPTVAGAKELILRFNDGVLALESSFKEHAISTHELAFAFFLFGALNQFFFDGNKRTSRLMMNGILMSNGYEAVTIPASKAIEFNRNMVDFYASKNATDMIKFLFECAKS